METNQKGAPSRSLLFRERETSSRCLFPRQFPSLKEKSFQDCESGVIGTPRGLPVCLLPHCHPRAGRDPGCSRPAPTPTSCLWRVQAW